MKCSMLRVSFLNYLNNKFLLFYLQSVILFCTLTSKNAIFRLSGRFFSYKVGKLIFLWFVFEVCTL